MDNLFVFPDSVNRQYESEYISLNCFDNLLEFHHCNEALIIDTDLLTEGSSTVVMNNPTTGNTYVLYNFREILQALNMMPSEFMNTLCQRCFMQIDKSGGKLFIKVFLLKGDYVLQSDTEDFTENSYRTLEQIHELDWEYSWTVHNIKAHLEDEKILLSFDIKKSDFWQEKIYISHAGQSIEVKPGFNCVAFTFVPTELVYFGSYNSHYKGRAVNVKELIE